MQRSCKIFISIAGNATSEEAEECRTKGAPAPWNVATDTIAFHIGKHKGQRNDLTKERTK